MSTESQVMALLEEGNPAIELPETASRTTATAYLASLDERSSDVTQLDAKPEERARPPRNRLFAAAAALVIAVGLFVGIGVILANNGETEVPPATQPSPAPEVAPTTVPVVALDFTAIEGTWAGPVVQDDEFSAWAEVSVTEGAEPNSSVGSVIFRSSEESPNIFCEGSWLAKSAEPPVYSVFEVFPGASACDNGPVTLTYDPDSGSLLYLYENPAYQTTGTLDRTTP